MTKNFHKTQFPVFEAYQHFLYYIDVADIKAKKIWGEHLTDHFMMKLSYYQSLREVNYLRPDVIVEWIQNMSPENQKTLLIYIIENHLNKW